MADVSHFTNHMFMLPQQFPTYLISTMLFVEQKNTEFAHETAAFFMSILEITVTEDISVIFSVETNIPLLALSRLLTSATLQ